MRILLQCLCFALATLIFGLALTLSAGKAEAQTTNCVSMGGGMVHCDSIGAGGMSSSDCMAIGPNMATCNSIGGGGGEMASPVEIYRAIFGDKTKKNISKMLANGDCGGAAKYAYQHNRLELGNEITRTCRSGSGL